MKILCLPLALVLGAFGQEESNAGVDATRDCAGINFEKEKYRIGTVTVRDPFDYLRWIRSKRSDTQARLTILLSNHEFTYQLARDDALAFIEQQRFLPDTFGGLRVSVETVSAANCGKN